MAKFFKKSQQAPEAKTGAVSGSEAIDDYLKAIFQLSGREERQVSSTEIAGTLAITAASVTNMLQKLAALEPPLVEYENHPGVQLSKPVKKRPLKLIPHHRLLQTFLHQFPAYPSADCNKEASGL